MQGSNRPFNITPCKFKRSKSNNLILEFPDFSKLFNYIHINQHETYPNRRTTMRALVLFTQ